MEDTEKTERFGIIILQRNRSAEGPSTSLSCDKTKLVDDEDSLREALTSAVTEWMRQTADGKAAFEYAQDFNLGNLLANWDHTNVEDSLIPFLAANGIKNLRCDADILAMDWTYDTVLCEPVSLQEGWEAGQ